MLYTLIIIAGVSRTPPAIAVVPSFFSNLQSCQVAGQSWVDAANAGVRGIGASYVCFGGAAR